MKLPWYPQGTPCIVYLFGVSGTILVFVTLVAAAVAWKHPQTLRPWLYLLAAIWAIMPSLWFWYEYHYMLAGVIDEKQLEKYKYGVQLGAAIWAGVAISLAAYVNSDHFKPLPEQPNIAPTLQQTPASINPASTLTPSPVVTVAPATEKKN